VSDGGNTPRRDVIDDVPHVVAAKSRVRRSHRLAVLPQEPREGLPPGGREECRTGPRPCPYVRCKHHLWMRVGEERQGSGNTSVGSTVEPVTWTTCALDVAESGPRSTREIAEWLGVSMRRVQQLIKAGIAKLAAKQRGR
jgi:hypothetical protein